MKRFAKFLAALIVVVISLSSIAALADTRIVTTGDVHLRGGAGTAFASLAVIGKGARLSTDSTVVDDRGIAWYRVTYGGRTGWVSSVYAAPDTGASGYVTTTGQVNLRRGAGTGYAAVTSVPKGVTVPFDWAAKDERGVIWFHVSYNGANGWISSMYARESAAPAPAAVGTVIVSARLNIRAGAGTEYRVLGAIDRNRTAAWLGEAAKDSAGVTWYRISYAGVIGWVTSQYARVL